MKLNYLMVSKWSPGSGVDVPELRRKIHAIGSKAARLAKAYERELNDGVEFDMELVVKKNISLYHVCSITFSDARNYVDFPKWENCQDYFEKRRK